MIDIVLNARDGLTEQISLSAPLYALLAAIFLLVFFSMLGLLKREGRIRQLVATGYYVYLPLVFCLSAFAWTAAVSAESSVIGAFTDLRPALTGLSLESADTIWPRLKEEYGGKQDIDPKEFGQRAADEYGAEFFRSVQGLIAARQLEAVMENISPGVHARLSQRLEEDILVATVNTSADEDSASINAQANMRVQANNSADENSAGISAHAQSQQVNFTLLQSAWEGDFAHHLKDGLMADILIEQVRHLFTLFFKKIQLFFILLTVPVIVEVGYALYQRPKLPNS